MHFLSVPGNDYVLTSGANWPLRDSGRSSRNREETMTTETKPATFREWFKQNLAEDYGRDIANHGADAGYPHITNTADTVELFDQYGEEIWEMAVEEAESMGCKNVAEMIAGFKRADRIGSLATFKNLMVWYAVERLAREGED
jgi:hypothetical protein